MLIALFIISAVVLIASAWKRPTALWQRGITLLAAILMLATLVAFTLEYIAQSSHTEESATAQAQLTI